MTQLKTDPRARTLAYGAPPRPAPVGPRGTVVSPAAPAPPASSPVAPQKVDLSFASTVVDGPPSAALDATIAAADVDTLSPASSVGALGAPSSGLPASALPTSGIPAAARVTVLPRIETVGSETRIVRETRIRYVHERKLGEGGVGEVLGAVDQDIGRRVAVKRLHPGTSSDASLLRFADEVRTIGRLEHPNIVPIHDVGVDEHGDHYFVMKYVDGETLESIIEKLSAGDPGYHAKYTVERRVEIFMALLEAVGFAHAQGIIHRDIKPANVMVGAYGEVVLMDWGVAKIKARPEGAPLAPPPFADGSSPASALPVLSSESNARTTGVGGIVGTPFYMSPEQSKGQPVDERSDVYSLTLLFYELLGLVHPLAGKRSLPEVLDAVSAEPVPSVLAIQSAKTPTVPAELVHFLRHGLEKDPANRYPNVDAMLARLRARADGEIPVECPVTFMKQNTNKWTRFVDNHPFVAMVAAGVGALGVLGSVSLLVLVALGVLHR